MKTKFTFLFLLLSLSFTYAQTIRYVRPVASGSGDGSSWANASNNLQAMINASGVQEVWVAAGTYKPTTGTDRNISFNMKNGVTIYGGFPNDGSGTLANRNPIANETILSGDIGNAGEVNDNSCHVVANGNGINSTAKLDGFVITGGNANVTTSPFTQFYGGGILNDGRNGTCSPTFTNCILKQNSAYFGGGVHNYGVQGTCNPTFSNCVFYQNQALYNGSISNGGAFSCVGNVNTVLTNCTFANNSALGRGGALYLDNNFGSPNVTLKNCILWGNSANAAGNQVYLAYSTLNISNTTLQGGLAAISTVGTNTINNNILTTDPLFVEANTGDLRLTACSPALNVGDNTGVASTDITGSPRIFNSGTVDLGAYEFQGTAVTAPTAVSISSTTACQGTSVNLQATCTSGTVNWYNASTGGTALGTGSSFSYIAPVGANQTFYASCKDATCETALIGTSTALTVNAKPSVPTITPPSQFVVCSPTTLTLTASCATGNVVWSDNSTGTNLTLNSVGTYSISAKCVLNGCDSDPSSATNLEIKVKPSVPIITPPNQLVVCSPTSLTLTANCTTGTVLWSNNSTTGTSLTLNSVGTYSISAKCTLNGCESDPSSATNLEIKAKPSVPTITLPSQLVVCSPTSLTLTANCTTGTVLWSNNSTGTSLTLNSVGPYSISAKCVLNGCDSDASSVTNLEIKAKPSVPTITPPSQLVVCSPSTLTLTATCASGTVLWSDNSTTSSLLLSAVGTYSISAKCVLNGCESDPSSATNLEIKAKPSVPTVTPPSQLVVCSPTSLTLTANCTTGTVLWSNNSTSTSLTLNLVGTYSISAKCTLNGCESDPSSTTNLEIKAKPSVPTVTPPSQLVVCSPSTLTLTANCVSGNVVWSDNSTGTSLTLNSVGTYSISAKCTLNGCESDPSSATNLEIKAKPTTPIPMIKTSLCCL